MQRWLDPQVLNAISGLDLVARTVVDGFIAGLHRSADFGFSQEFAEYRAYVPGDDLRHVDWNVYARSGRMYLKRFQGETNSVLTLLLDASNSMNFASHVVSKIDYARYAAAALAYLAGRQRDAAGLIVFDDEVRSRVRPSGTHGQLARILAALEAAEPRSRTRFEAPITGFQELLRRRGVVVYISDFYADPDLIIRAVEPLRAHGSEVVLFHVLDPQELRPELTGPALFVDLETGERMEVSGDYARGRYRERMAGHLARLAEGAQRAGMTHQVLDTAAPLDAALARYLRVRTAAP